MKTKAAILKFSKTADGELLPLALSVLMQTVFLGGYKGAGKTSAMKRLFEAAFEAGAQCVAVAPLGKWWSLRIAKNGRGPGLRGIVVFGGQYGDVPIMAGSGRTLARIVVSKHLSCVLDVEQMRKVDRALFLRDFFEELMLLRKAQRANKALVVFLDEAQAVAPQIASGKEVQALKEVLGDFCRECRNFGAGMVLSAQRSANVDKDLLALVEVLFAMRTIHHIDREVYRKWVAEKGGDDEDDSAWLKRLRRFSKGEAYAYVPEASIFERVQILMPKTFDATATVSIGAKVAKVGRLSKLDVRKLGEELTTVVEQAQADDPKALKARVTELEIALGAKTLRVKALEAMGAPSVKKSAPAFKKRDVQRLEKLAKQVRKEMHRAEKLTSSVAKISACTLDVVARLRDGAQALDVRAKIPVPESRAAEKNRLFGERYSVAPGALYDKLTETTRTERGAMKFALRTQGVPFPEAGATVKQIRAKLDPADAAPVKLGKGERKIMIAIAQHGMGVTREQLTVMTGYKRSTRDAYLLRLIGAGYASIDSVVSGSVIARGAGIEWLGNDYAPLPTGDALREHWLAKLPSGESKILELVCRSPGGLSRDEITAATGFKRSTRDAYLYRLIKRQLVSEGPTGIYPSPGLFS